MHKNITTAALHHLDIPQSLPIIIHVMGTYIRSCALWKSVPVSRVSGSVVSCLSELSSCCVTCTREVHLSCNSRESDSSLSHSSKVNTSDLRYTTASRKMAICAQTAILLIACVVCHVTAEEQVPAASRVALVIPAESAAIEAKNDKPLAAAASSNDLQTAETHGSSYYGGGSSYKKGGHKGGHSSHGSHGGNHMSDGHSSHGDYGSHGSKDYKKGGMDKHNSYHADNASGHKGGKHSDHLSKSNYSKDKGHGYIKSWSWDRKYNICDRSFM